MSGKPKRFDIDVAVEAEKTLDDLRQAASPKDVPAEVFSRLKGLPVMLRTSGVPATLAFFAAKSDTQSAVGKAYQKVSWALHQQLAVGLGTKEVAPTGLYARLRDQTDTATMLRAFGRLQAYAGWLRRLAEALEHEQQAATRIPKAAASTPAEPPATAPTPRPPTVGPSAVSETPAGTPPMPASAAKPQTVTPPAAQPVVVTPLNIPPKRAAHG